MKITVVSDNHGLIQVLNKVKEANKDSSFFIHCGDSELEEKYLSCFISVRGNNDYYSTIKEYQVLEVEGHRILIIHGHRLIFMNSYQNLVLKAKQLDCDIVLFGHTHVFTDIVIDQVRLINPGSLSYNRDFSPCCYANLYLKKDEIKVERINI
ncbi:MAG: metallophosphoesterase [Erysipelotrichaceae bacterium]|nr:metallophosphoesterase [Erysipelotrichaceae bacterium]MDO5085675.1 metallophosphoesterase [Erysipelotrichaceae bacterium]